MLRVRAMLAGQTIGNTASYASCTEVLSIGSGSGSCMSTRRLHPSLGISLGALPQAMETRQLARESQQRLNGFMDQLRGSVAVDLSAKNLGEEGTQYVAEALAFNDRRATRRRLQPIQRLCVTMHRMRM